VARQANSAQHVGLEEAQPVFVGDLLEGLGFEDAEVVDEDVDLGQLCDHVAAALGLSEVQRDAVDAGSGDIRLDSRHRLFDAPPGAAVYGDVGTFTG
jgi:hypothetical protein